MSIGRQREEREALTHSRCQDACEQILVPAVNISACVDAMDAMIADGVR